MAQRTGDGCTDHRGGLAALTADEDLRDVAAGAALVDPELPAALGVVFVDEPIPVDVSDVALTAGTDKAGWDDRVLALVVVDELALGQPLAVDQQAGAGQSALIVTQYVLGDEP